jgi:hypothetical protein
MAEAGERSAAELPAREGSASEEEAWAAVRASWGDEAAHEAYLARFGDLGGLAVAGGRYRAALLERPEDAVASRWRDEVVRRATAQALATLPRSSPAVRSSAKRLRALLAALVGALLALAAYEAVRILGARS